jgi:hypothetical protein
MFSISCVQSILLTFPLSAFRHILTADQENHGVNNYEIDEETLDLFQQEVDDVIDANLVDAATTA